MRPLKTGQNMKMSSESGLKASRRSMAGES
jgi:hypothetical protein